MKVIRRGASAWSPPDRPGCEPNAPSCLPMSTYYVRPLRPRDAAVVAHHRFGMFLAMGDLAAADVPALEAASREQLDLLIVSGEYFGCGQLKL